MCLHRRQLDSTSRRMRSAGGLCLFAGLALALFPGAFALRHPDFYLGMRFVLILSAIGLLLWSSRRSGGCVTPPAERNS